MGPEHHADGDIIGDVTDGSAKQGPQEEFIVHSSQFIVGDDSFRVAKLQKNIEDCGYEVKKSAFFGAAGADVKIFV
jgi:hypothetical protein